MRLTAGACLAAAAYASASSSQSTYNRPDSKVARNVLEGKAEGYCSPSGPIESTHCLYENVETLNRALFPALHELVEYPFFRHYKVDLYKECPFWYENGFCMNRACGIEEASESEGVSGCYFKEQDFCYVEDDADQSDSAHNVWRAIYEENCFGLSEASLSETMKPRGDLASAVVGAGGISRPSDVGSDWGFSKLSEGWGTEMVKAPTNGEGLHASISIHICADYLDQTTGEWAPNLDCFISRLATHPERLSNVYFNAVLLLRAVERAAPYLEAYDIATAPALGSGAKAGRESDRLAKVKLDQVLSLASSGISRGFDENDFFTGGDAVILKEQFKNHFRNVSRIMDCVGCDKCRLWGKLQVSGIGTALKILFAVDDAAFEISESLAAVEEFRKIYAATQEEEVSGGKQKAIEKVCYVAFGRH
ncbi:hypothetical protein IAU60_005049 [Kwoniella sp. DSM 27419]